MSNSSLLGAAKSVREFVIKTLTPKPLVWRSCAELIEDVARNYPNTNVAKEVKYRFCGRDFVRDTEWKYIINEATKGLDKPDLVYDAGMAFPSLSPDGISVNRVLHLPV